MAILNRVTPMPNAINQTIRESCDAEAMFTADIAKSTADMAAASTHLAERLWFQRHARDCDRNEVEPCKKTVFYLLKNRSRVYFVEI